MPRRKLTPSSTPPLHRAILLLFIAGLPASTAFRSLSKSMPSRIVRRGPLASLSTAAQRRLRRHRHRDPPLKPARISAAATPYGDCPTAGETLFLNRSEASNPAARTIAPTARKIGFCTTSTASTGSPTPSPASSRALTYSTTRLSTSTKCKQHAKLPHHSSLRQPSYQHKSHREDRPQLQRKFQAQVQHKGHPPNQRKGHR